MRDTKIDVLRGLAIFTITLNHFTWLASDLGLEARAFPTLTQFGFSSSAEIFFLLSGYLVGQVYTGIYRKYGLARMVGKCLDRAYKLYVYNLILLGVCVAITAVAAPGVAQVTFAEPFLRDPVSSLVAFSVALVTPYGLDILFTYVLLLAVTPGFVVVASRSRIAALVITLSLYALTQIIPGFNLPGGVPEGDRLWNLNPFAWQFLFFGGALLGMSRWLERWCATRTRSKLAGALGLFAFLTLLYALNGRYDQWAFLHPFGDAVFPLPGTSKTDLGLLRMTHAVTLVLLAMLFLTAFPGLLRWLPSRVLGWVGYNSLSTFCISLAVSYTATALWVGLGGGGTLYLSLCILSVFVMAGAGWIVTAPTRGASSNAAKIYSSALYAISMWQWDRRKTSPDSRALAHCTPS
jgi:hypothetical protein